MDESLILLQDLLCWPLANMTYLDQNKRKGDQRNRLKPETRTALEKWLWADCLLYDHFRSVLDRKLAEFGQDSPRTLEDRVYKLRASNRALVRKCVRDQVDNEHGLEGQFKVALNSVVGYRVNKKHFEQCKLYATTEPYFTNILRNKQFPTSPSERVPKVKPA